LVRLFLPYLEQTGLELYFAPTAVRWGPRSEVEPDLFVLLTLRDATTRYIDGLRTLVLVVEVLSPTSVRADRFTERAAYLANGVPDYWIVDTANRLVERWRPGDDEPDVIVGSLVWQPMPDAPPLFIDLESYFRSVLGE